MDKKNPILIIGAGTVGKMAYDAFTSNSVVVYGFLDDHAKPQETIGEVPVLGKTDDADLTKIIGKDCEVFIASDDNKEKKSIVEYVNKERHTMPSNAVHAEAKVSGTAHLGYGNLISQGAMVNAFAVVHNHCMVHSGAIVDAEAVLEDYVQVGAGAIINAKVEIAEGAFIGSGVVIVGGVKIGKGAKIGAGSVVIADVAANETVFGNPAKKV